MWNSTFYKVFVFIFEKNKRGFAIVYDVHNNKREKKNTEYVLDVVDICSKKQYQLKNKDTSGN